MTASLIARIKWRLFNEDSSICGSLNIRRRLYRITMRIAHRYGWHYAPKKPMPMPDTSAPGTSFHWCQWCGLRGTTYDPRLDPTAPLRIHRP